MTDIRQPPGDRTSPTLSLARARAAELSDEHGLNQTAWTGAYRQCGVAHIENQVGYHAEAVGGLCVRRDRDGQGELKSCAVPGGASDPQAAAMRLNDRATDG